LQLHSPARVFLQRAGIAVVVLLLAYLVFEFGRIQGGYDILDVKKERQASEDAVAGLQQEIVALKEQIALLETDQEPRSRNKRTRSRSTAASCRRRTVRPGSACRTSS
jgi:cell division protein FtsB